MFGLGSHSAVYKLADEELDRIAEAVLTNPKIEALVTCVIEETTQKVLAEFAARLAPHPSAH